MATKIATNPVNKQFMNMLNILLIALVCSVIGFMVGYRYALTPNPIQVPRPIDPGIGNGESGEGVYCTMDAKICPDGSAVGRVAPKCEFAPCPGQ